MKILFGIIRFLSFLCLIMGNVSMWASKAEIPFNSLQHEKILCVTSDKYGITWIGTSKGIFQYDGQTLYKYYRNSKAKTQMKSIVYNIFVGKDSTLVAVSDNGLYLYQPEQDTFQEQVCRIHFNNVADRLLNGNYLMLDNISQKVFLVDPTLNKMLASVHLDEISPLQSQIVRLSTGNYCICGTNSFIIISPELQVLKKIKVPAQIVWASEVMERIIIGTVNGYYTYSYNGIRVSNNAMLDQYTAGLCVDFIIQNSADRLFLGVTGKGIYCYNHDTDQIHIVSQSLDPVIVNRHLSLLHLDQNQQLWLCGNIDKAFLGLTVLKAHSTYPSFQELLTINENNSLRLIEMATINNEGIPYIFTTQNLYKYIKEEGKLVYIMPLPEKGNCIDMLFDKQGRLYIISRNAIYIYSMNDKERPRLIKKVAEDGYKVSMNVVTDDYISLSYPGRLISFDKNLTITRHITPNTGYPMQICLALNKQDLYVRSGYNYSASYNPFKGFWNEKTAPYPNNINYQLRDSRGEIWYATDNTGVVHFNSDGTPIDTLDMSSGLPDNSVYAVEEDKGGNIWITTNNGIAKYVTRSGKVYNYEEVNGMLRDSRQKRMLKAFNGDLYMYSSTHLLLIRSIDNVATSIPPKPLVKSVLLNNKTFYGYPTRLYAAHDENNLTLDFVSVDMMRSALISYEYRLQGYDPDWVASGNNRSVVYNNLPPGKYHFQVRARYGTNPYSETTELPIHIHPAFYQTVWFKASVTLAVLVLAFLFVRNLLRTRIAIAESHFAVENERLKVELYSNLSHLIRTPVSLINAPFQELVAGRKWDSHEQELIAVIRKSIDRIMDITKQFLERWSDADNQVAADTTLQVEMKDLSAIVRETALMFRPTANQAGISLSLDIPESLPVPIDEDKIIKILYNLVNNALKYTPRGGNVKIAVQRQEDTLTIAVTDTGRGIPDEQKKRIFDRFYTAGNGASATDSHFGIGLCHTRQLVLLHNGTITVRDNKPQGTAFVVTLPAKSQAYAVPEAAAAMPLAEEKAAAMEQERDGTADDAKPHLLLVEDNEDMLSYLAASLRRRYKVVAVHDGMEALDLFARESIDLVVTDVMMPRMDGYALCRWVKESAEYCHIPVVILTAKSAKADELEGLGCGADAYLTKPFDPTKLMVILNNLLENRKRMQAILLKRFAPDTPQPAEGEPEEEKTLKAAINEKDSAFMEKLYALLEEHLYDDQFNIARICQELGFSKTVLAKKIRALTGATPNQVVTEFRFSKVKELMATRKYTLSEIAYMTGFSSISTFSRRFRAIYNMSPTEYMRKNGLNQ